MSQFNNFQPRLAVTVGDPAGIGPEVVLKALADPQVAYGCEITVVGSRSLLERTYDQLRSNNSEISLTNPDQLAILDCALEPAIAQVIASGRESAASGAASFRYMETAIAHTIEGHFHGIVTGPIAKSAWKAAGHHYPGQTELLAERAGVDRFGMLFVARSPYTGWVLRTLLATTHIPLHQVPSALTPNLLTRKLDLLIECLQQDFGLSSPRIAIAGLNPHSGEQGQLGHEEKDWLIPWLEETRSRLPNIQLDGPVPPDTLWVKPGQAWFGPGTRTQGSDNSEFRIQNSKFKTQNSFPTPDPPFHSPADAYLALYHDQGLIPVKLMAFDRAVNTSIGLPFVRTSPDHGTAFDIAGKGIADATSMKAAVELAVELCSQRQRL